MKIEVLEVRADDTGTLVQFRTRTGEGRALWADAVVPEPGRDYDVELDVDGSIADFTPARAASSSVGTRWVAGATTCTGVLESVDPDGMGWFRLSDDCLVMLPTSPGWTDPGEVVAISVPPTSLRMTPFGT